MTNVPTELAQLRAEVAELRHLVEQLTSGNADLTVRRLAVSDGLGDRITLEAEALGEARVDVKLSPDSDSTVSLFAYPCADERGLGISVWAEGNHCTSLTAVEMTDEIRGPESPEGAVGWLAELAMDQDVETLVSDHLRINPTETRRRRTDLRGIELPIRRDDD